MLRSATRSRSKHSATSSTAPRWTSVDTNTRPSPTPSSTDGASRVRSAGWRSASSRRRTAQQPSGWRTSSASRSSSRTSCATSARTCASVACTCRRRTSTASSVTSPDGRIEGPAELLVAFEAQRALGLLEHGLTLVTLLDRRSAACVLAMAGSYRRLLERIATHPHLVLGGRPSLRRWEKGWVLAQSLARSAA